MSGLTPAPTRYCWQAIQPFAVIPKSHAAHTFGPTLYPYFATTRVQSTGAAWAGALVMSGRAVAATRTPVALARRRKDDLRTITPFFGRTPTLGRCVDH